ncbi:hypothetical protein FQN53_003568 [Emmonsiellopsis sp. PD_33]|nr:hypothetical protein FQN53_003568 [Emmonsiellopsis sp. PD_33]
MSLLVNDNYRDLHRRAQNQSLPESATATLWTTIIAGYGLGPEQPPVEEDRRRVDLHVSVKHPERPRRPVVYVEFKRASTSRDVRRAEAQVTDYCMAWLARNPQQPQWMAAMLCIGPRAKLWYVGRDSPYLPRSVFICAGASNARSLRRTLQRTGSRIRAGR